MALTNSQLAVIREQIGATSPPTDEDLENRFARTGDVQAVILEVLRGRLADFLSGPTSISIPGVYSESHGEAVTALRDQIAGIETGDGDRLATTRLVRRGRSRSVRNVRNVPF